MSYDLRDSRLVFGIGLLSIVLAFGQASQYDPHVYPYTGPFFEGWYTRLTDADHHRSLGVLFGRVLPLGKRDNQSYGTPAAVPTTYIGLLRSNGDESPLVVSEAYPDEEDITVTVGDSQPVTAYPERKTPAHFQWVAKPYGYFNVTPHSTVFNFTIDNVTFMGNFSYPILWDSTGNGPEGWLSYLPFLPIHWFVYSLGSSGTYVWSNASSGLVLSGSARAHQEKNVGESFPYGWVWTQAYDQAANASFAGTFGVVSPLNITAGIPAHLFGYRNFGRGLSLDFRPDNSVTTRDLRPCKGTAHVTIWSSRYKVDIAASAPVGSYDKCLRGPVEIGFVPNVVETYSATIRVTIKKRGIFDISYRLIEDHTFHHAAFEFGRNYMCPKNPCQRNFHNSH